MSRLNTPRILRPWPTKKRCCARLAASRKIKMFAKRRRTAFLWGDFPRIVCWQFPTWYVNCSGKTSVKWKLPLSMSHVERSATTPLRLNTRRMRRRIFLFLIRNCSLYQIGCFLEHPTKWKIVCVERRQWLQAEYKIFRNFQLLGEATSVRNEAGKSFARIFFAFLGAHFLRS